MLLAVLQKWGNAKGEIWFGEAAMTRMVRWIEKNIDVESKIIDLGCGNGLMSIELYEVAGHFNHEFFQSRLFNTNKQPWSF